MSIKELESMTLQEIKDLYKTLTNAVPVVGTGKNGCKIKQNWIEAVQKSVETESQPDQTEGEPNQDGFNRLLQKREYYKDLHSRELQAMKTSVGNLSALKPCTEWAQMSNSNLLHWIFTKIECPPREVMIKLATELELKEKYSCHGIGSGCTDFLYREKFKDAYIVKFGAYQETESQPDQTEEATEWEEIPDHEQIPFYDPDYTPDPEEELIDENGYRSLSQQEKIKLPISFGWTADRLLAGMKTVTRRTWQDNYAQIFVKAYQQGKLVPAFDRDRRYGGKLIGYLKLTSEPYKESVWDLPPNDVEAEGYPELEWDEFLAKFFGDLMGLRDDNPRTKLWVIRFEFYPLETEIDEIPLIDETPKDIGHCELNTNQQILLEKYKFEKIGHAFEDSPFIGNEPYCSFAGWEVHLSQNIPYPAKLATLPKLTMLSLVNYEKNEWWGLKLNCYGTTKNRTHLKRFARKIILELILSLEQKTGVKI